MSAHGRSFACMRRRSIACAIVAASAFTGCALHPPEYDYQAYLQHMPRSILVLPPLDDTFELDASDGCLSRITQPLADRGYYVFPVAVVEAMMKENGLPTPYEMNGVSLQKIDEIFAADAVLYLTVKKWGTTFRLLGPSTIVSVEGRLVDVKTGMELWRGSASAQPETYTTTVGTGAGQHTVVNTRPTTSLELAEKANHTLVWAWYVGMLPGVYDPQRDAELKKRGFALGQ